jgi:murein DD-endopeptidase MepM/ murein hydrolase activator NlpD
MKKLWILILVLILGAIGFVYFSPMFERVPPQIIIKTNGFTNLKNPIEIEIKDNTGIKSYDVVVLTSTGVEEIAKVAEPDLGKDVKLKIALPKDIRDSRIKLIVRACDISKWHFFAGNCTKKEVVLKVDKTAPDTEIIGNSYAIGKGGSAAVVVKVQDKNLKDAYILVDNKYKFKLTPFVKKGYYAALIAWPIWENSFSADLVAEDEAGNIAKEHIPLFWRTRGIYNPRNVKITIDDRFINTVAKRVLTKMNMDIPNDPVEIFKKVNETVRAINEKELYNLTRNVEEQKINGFYITRFNPLPGSAKKADFGEKRHYYYKGQEISFAIHKGLDLAKVRHAKIYASNLGKVVAEKYIGIYGNTLVLYHKLGLYSTYSHTSAFKVNVGDTVRKGTNIALTGATGAVFGDHLHFGIYIQGIPVQPIEWMDQHWINTNIVKVFRDSKRLILK